MKNKIVSKLLSNDAARRVVGEISKFYVNHESTILMGGTIGFSLATTSVTMKNAVKINEVITNARIALKECNTKAERDRVYKMFLKDLFPLIIPILIFQAATIGCAVKSKKQLDSKDKKLAEFAGALSIAQSAVTQYQAFQKEAEEALGPEKYQKVQEDIYKKKDFDGRRFSYVASEGAPGEVLFIDKYSGKPFWSTFDRCNNAARELSRLLGAGQREVVSIDDWHEEIGNKDLISDGESGVLTSKFGYVADGYGADDIIARTADTHYIFPNGTRIPAFLVYLYPEPRALDYEI